MNKLTNKENVELWKIISKNNHLDASEISFLWDPSNGNHGKRISNAKLKTFREKIKKFESFWISIGKSGLVFSSGQSL